MSMDRIEKSTILRAPRAQVWKALADPKAFGEWFGVKLNGSFEPGARLRGKVTHKGYEDTPFEMTIDRIEPERLLSWWWHPYAIDPNADYSNESETLVELKLEDVSGGTRFSVTESGFETVPVVRRHEAYTANDEGWDMQLGAIERYLKRAA